ncbi:MAG TPA: ATP-binding protein [Candidatus Dormibacteraeota bacterium]|nr:ATP-binding protein [Candidatus Dormibacteraeota bacterium]
MSPHYRAAYTGDPRNVSLARNAIASFASMCGFSESDVADIRLAAGEALSNAVEHGRSARSNGFSVVCRFEDGEIAIEIRDNGDGFSIEGSQAAPLEERARGFGMGLMCSLMDGVNYDHNGTRVRLYRRLEEPHAPG